MNTGLAGQTLLADDFTAGLDAGAPGSRWRLRPVRGFPAGDGLVTSGPRGLDVVPTGRGAGGQPAFAKPEQPLAEGEHLRWAVFVNRDTGDGHPGVRVPDGGGLVFSATLAVRGYAMDRHPYGREIADPHRDLRLGSAAVICMDRQTGLVLDAVVTDRCVFAVYERLAFPGTAHAGFSYAIPVADRQPDHEHRVSLAYDRSDGSARWYLGAEEVFRVDTLGLRLDGGRHLLRDNGAPDQPVLPRQMYCGVATFTERIFGQGIRLGLRGATLRTLTR